MHELVSCIHAFVSLICTHRLMLTPVPPVYIWLLLNYLCQGERKKKEVYLYSAIYCDTLKALRHGSHSFTCK